MKKKILAFLIIISALFLDSSFAFAYPPYIQDSNLAIVGPYDNATSGAANSGSGTACLSSSCTREFINIGQQYRIRQNGTISRVRLYVGVKTNLTGFYVKIWRKNGTTYDLVGASNNIAGSLSSNTYNTVDLSTPITGVQEGDYYSYRIEANQGSEYETYVKAKTGVTLYYATNEVPATTSYDWASKTASANQAMPIELYMTAPQVVFIGDSIIAGHPAHYSFLESTATTNIPVTIENQFSAITGYTYQNTGIGSQSTTQILARFTNDMINLKPRVAFIYGSGNDGYSSANKATFISNWTAMLNAAQASSDIQTIIVLKLLPWTGGTNTQMQVKDDWNASLVTLAANYSKAIVADANSRVGQFREGGDEGNLWDIKPEYNADGVHYNSAGYGQIAQAIAASLDSTPPTIASITSRNNSGAYKAGQTIQLNINFSEAVNATSSVSLLLNTTPARGCTFTVASSATSTCDYIVQDGDNAATLNVTSISGTIKDLVDNPMTDYAPAANLSASKTITIDTVAPTVSISSFPIVNNLNKSAVEISGTCSENGLSVSMDIGGITATPNCSSGAWSTTVDLHTLTDGTITANVSQTDTAGNIGSNSLTSTKDTTNPTVTGLSNDSTPTKSKTWTWGYGDESATFRYAIDQVLAWTATGDFASTTTAILPSGNGTYYLHVQAQDGVGNVSTVATVSAILDNTPPVITVSGDNPATVAQGSTYADGGATATDNIDSSITVTTGGTVNTATLGDYTITYNATDVADNAATSATRLVHVTDQASPIISAVIASPSRTSAAITWTTSEVASSKVEYGLTGSYGNTTDEADTSTRVTSHSVALSGLNACTAYHYRVKSKDADSNEAIGNDSTFTTTGCSSGSTSGGWAVPIRLAPLTPVVTTTTPTTPTTTANNSDTQKRIELLKQLIVLLQQQLQNKTGNPQSINQQDNKTNVIYSCNEITKTLSYGMEGAEVKCLQEVLKSQGPAIYPYASATGFYLSGTRLAVKKFQEKYPNEILKPFGLKQGNGIAGINTRKIINQILAGQTVPAN